MDDRTQVVVKKGEGGKSEKGTAWRNKIGQLDMVNNSPGVIQCMGKRCSKKLKEIVI